MNPTVASHCENIHICGVLMQFNLGQVSLSLNSSEKEVKNLKGDSRGKAKKEMEKKSSINIAICLLEFEQTGVQSVFSPCLSNCFTGVR